MAIHKPLRGCFSITGSFNLIFFKGVLVCLMAKSVPSWSQKRFKPMYGNRDATERKKKKERGTSEQLRWRNGIGTSQTGEEKPLTAIWYQVLSLMRREAILSTEAPTSHITHERTIWFGLSITAYGSSQWYGAELLLLKTKKKGTIYLTGAKIQHLAMWRQILRQKKRNQQEIWSLNCCLRKKKKTKTISAMWYRLYSFSLLNWAKIWGWRM